MSKVEMPVSGGGPDKGEPDGVSGSPGGSAEVSGRTPGGESGGGGYDNPHSGKEPTGGGFMGHGGQTEIGYHGGGQAGEQGGDAPNAATGSDSSDGAERESSAWTAPTYEPHAVSAGGRAFQVVETNGIAQAEVLGKVGTDAAYEEEQESPGSG
ncbi:hypothetical protein [uncultured Sphingomonas sp.]|uniref:hypothetical protein n=1 Tax=uncultured Sphingomonas sp. TaxID=158754 RepID=UPI0035CB7BBE